ncbi:MAG: DUF3786 domain-containing protein [Dehalococcoidia bacterium]|nr:MAG: DUF3786 domain-containing protein [Dehalococcoidia bacterium]
MINGEDLAWAELLDSNPQEITKQALADYDALSQIYTLKSFSQDISISIKEKRVFSSSSLAKFLLTDLRFYSNLVILTYLVKARNIPLATELKNPSQLNAGLMYERGAHQLPLDKLAEKFDDSLDGFIERSLALGGQAIDFGDAAFQLFPLPRIALALIAWKKDDEFPTRFNLLFDASCEKQLPPDILWAAAMMSILMVIEENVSTYK